MSPASHPAPLQPLWTMMRSFYNDGQLGNRFMDMEVDSLGCVRDCEEHTFCHRHGRVARTSRSLWSDLCYAVPAENCPGLLYIDQYLCPLGISSESILRLMANNLFKRTQSAGLKPILCTVCNWLLCLCLSYMWVWRCKNYLSQAVKYRTAGYFNGHTVFLVHWA